VSREAAVEAYGVDPDVLEDALADGRPGEAATEPREEDDGS
jgi:hypothetical protein